MAPEGQRRRAERAVVSVLSSAACLAVAIALAVTVDRDGATGVYLPSNWPAPFGIALVAGAAVGRGALVAVAGGLVTVGGTAVAGSSVAVALAGSVNVGRGVVVSASSVALAARAATRATGP